MPQNCEISTIDLSYVVTIKSKVAISKNFVAFSDYMNFTQAYSGDVIPLNMTTANSIPPFIIQPPEG